MTKYEIYKEMYNNCENIAYQIKEHAETKGHEIYNNCVDVFVGNEETSKYFVDFEAKNKTGKYYRIRGNYTTDEMKKAGIIA